MNAEEYFEKHSFFPEGAVSGPFIYEEDFMQFSELKEQYLTKRVAELKDDTCLLLQYLVDHEWNISGPGLSRIKEFMATLNASK